MDIFAWRKASYSGGNGGGCVELAASEDGGFRIRDSKDPDGPVLSFTRHEKEAFRKGLAAGEFDDLLTA